MRDRAAGGLTALAKWAAAGERRPEFEVWVMDAPRKGLVRCVDSALAQLAKRIVTTAS